MSLILKGGGCSIEYISIQDYKQSSWIYHKNYRECSCGAILVPDLAMASTKGIPVVHKWVKEKKVDWANYPIDEDKVMILDDKP